jgi:hypothetical protein
MGTGVDAVRAWSDHFNARDWDTWLALVSRSAELVDLAQGVSAKGHDEMLA